MHTVCDYFHKLTFGGKIYTALHRYTAVERRFLLAKTIIYLLARKKIVQSFSHVMWERRLCFGLSQVTQWEEAVKKKRKKKKEKNLTDLIGCRRSLCTLYFTRMPGENYRRRPGLRCCACHSDEKGSKKNILICLI